MLKSTLLAIALLLSIPAATAAPGDVECYYRDFACYCTDNHEQSCEGIGGDSCAYSIGPTPATQVAAACDANPLRNDASQTNAKSSTSDGRLPYTCVINDFVCLCIDTMEYSCPDLTGDQECGASAGPSTGIQVGVLCPLPIGSEAQHRPVTRFNALQGRPTTE